MWESGVGGRYHPSGARAFANTKLNLRRILCQARISTLDHYVHPSDRATQEAMVRFGRHHSQG
jgi:hypothetical protein